MGAAAAVGAGLSIMSTMQAMKAAREQAEAAKAVADYNAKVARYQGQSAIAQASEDERRLRIQSGQVLGSIKANIGASGVQKDASVEDVLESSASNAELDALTVRHQGQLKAWAYEAGANLSLMKGDAAIREGQYNASAYLLKGAGSVLDRMPYSTSSESSTKLRQV